MALTRTIMGITMNKARSPGSTALLRILHLASPALPVGSFAFSQGLEWAIEEGGCNTEARLTEWWQALIREGLAHSDLPLLIRLQNAWEHNDHEALQRWNAETLALRETQELRDEDRQIGKALIKLLNSLDVDGAADWLTREPSYPLAWALAADRWHIPVQDSCLAYLWSWLENQVVAAGKILPLAQTPAQRILLALEPALQEAWDVGSALDDEQIGQSLPGWVHACARHETQYSRLFRS